MCGEDDQKALADDTVKKINKVFRGSIKSPATKDTIFTELFN